MSTPPEQLSIPEPERDWPLVQLALITHLNGLGVAPAGRTAPDDVHARPGFIRVRNAGAGGDDGRTDQTIIDFDCLAPDLDDVWRLARWLRLEVLSLHNRIIAGVQVDNVSTVASPAETPWSDRVFRVTYTARFQARLQPNP